MGEKRQGEKREKSDLEKKDKERGERREKFDLEERRRETRKEKKSNKKFMAFMSIPFQIWNGTIHQC